MPNSPLKQRLRDRGICVVIPTYNNVATIRDVVCRTLCHCDDVIVVNDGSTDGTARLLRELDGITLVDCKTNAGKGAALKRGFRKALDLGFAYAVTLDADGQHYPEDLPLMLEANIKHPGALLVGQRDMEGADRTRGSRFANAFSNFWFCVQTLRYLPDTQSGYRLYPLRRLHGLSLLTSRYEAELELLVFAAWHGVKIVPVPIHVYYPPRRERVSHFRPALDFTRISILNSLLCLLALVYALPLALARLMYTAVYTTFALSVYLVGALGVLTPFAAVYVPACRRIRRPPVRLHSLLHWFGKSVMRLFGLFGVKYTVDNPEGEDFRRPAVIICNHQSHLDLMVQLSLTSKIVFLTNDWVWRSPFFGYVIRNAEYCRASEGIETLMPKLKSLVARGYSISVFPEGTRSADGAVGRMHKGAFHIAGELGLDILPLVLYGTGKVLPKGGWYMRRRPVCISVCPRMTEAEQAAKGSSLRDRCRWFRQYYIHQYALLSDRVERYV